jgi:uncharacterized protein with FMN-binding domain
LTWADGTYNAVGFYAKGKAKAQVQVQHEKLKDAQAVKEMKEYWAARLSALAEMIEA